jgi:hypothetical protein
MRYFQQERKFEQNFNHLCVFRLHIGLSGFLKSLYFFSEFNNKLTFVAWLLQENAQPK